MLRRATALVLVVWAAATLAACSSSALTGRGSGQPESSTPAQSSSAVLTQPPPATSTTAATPTPRTSPTPNLVDNFDGTWTGHGRGITFAGTVGTMSYRVYTWCSDDPTPPCDDLQGNTIVDGGHITILLTTIYAAGSATVGVGKVTFSTDPTQVAEGTAVTARVQGTVLSITGFGSFCSPKTPPAQAENECGA